MSELEIMTRAQRDWDWKADNRPVCPICNGDCEHCLLDEATGEWYTVNCRRCGGKGRE